MRNYTLLTLTLKPDPEPLQRTSSCEEIKKKMLMFFMMFSSCCDEDLALHCL